MIRTSLRIGFVAVTVAAALAPFLSWARDDGASLRVQPKGAPASATTQDIVYFDETRPILIRLHVEVDDRDFDAAWDEYVEALFKFLDRDGDGLLDAKEIARAPTSQQFMQALGGNVMAAPMVVDPESQERDVAKQEFETDEDGKVTLEAFARFYKKYGAGPVRVTNYPPQGTAADALTDALFELLDTNRDGKLSQQELANAEKKIIQLDANEDDLVSTQELVSNIASYLQQPMERQPLQLEDQKKPAPPPPESKFFVVVSDGSARLGSQRLALAKKIISRYDKDGNGKLDHTEVSFLAEFNLLDRNKDGFLDSTELMRFLALPADVELTLRIGHNLADKALAEIVAPAGKATRMAKDVTTSVHGSAKFTNRATEIDMRGVEGNRADRSGTRQALLDTFHALDTERAGFLTKKQTEDPQFPILSQIFVIADRNDDGRLTERELREYLDLQAKAANAFIRISIADNGNGLFGLLDTNHDGHLGIRELRTAWDRLKRYDQDFDKCISRKELPHQFRVLVSRGEPVVNGPLLGATSPPAAGPLWFRLMDRNGDGDVSAREFLGTAEEFKRLDLDGDGLISIEEAIKADAGRVKR
jgi:Ca2+-binding EF-hand superfamily protein